MFAPRRPEDIPSSDWFDITELLQLRYDGPIPPSAYEDEIAHFRSKRDAEQGGEDKPC